MDVSIEGDYLYWNDGARVGAYSLIGPRIRAFRSGTDALLLSWAGPSSGFRLERRAIDTPSAWMPVTNAPITAGSDKQVFLQFSTNSECFRITYP